MAIGTGTAILGAAVIGGGAAMLSGGKQASAVGAAAELQAQAQRESTAELRRQYDQTRTDFAPYRETGTNALAEFAALYGIGRSPSAPESNAIERRIAELETRGFTSGDYGSPADVTAAIARLKGERDTLSGAQAGGDYRLSAEQMQTARDRFMATPGYEFRFDEGVRALDRSAAARGALRGGGYGRELVRYGQGVATEEFGKYSNALLGLAQMGQGATGSTAAAGAQTSGNIANIIQTGGQQQGNALTTAATARASGYAGAANAVQGGVSNYLLSNYLSGGRNYLSPTQEMAAINGGWR